MALSFIAKLIVRLIVNDGTSDVVNFDRSPGFAPGVQAIKVEQVSLTGSTFTALTPPTGASGVLIDTQGAPSLTVKGVTGDTGNVATPASNAKNIPICMPLASGSSVIGIANGSATAAVVMVAWF